MNPASLWRLNSERPPATRRAVARDRPDRRGECGLLLSASLGEEARSATRRAGTKEEIDRSSARGSVDRGPRHSRALLLSLVNSMAPASEDGHVCDKEAGTGGFTGRAVEGRRHRRRREQGVG